MIHTFFVFGIPQPGGSKRAFPFRRKDGTLGVSVTDDNKRSKPWQALVTDAAREAGVPLLSGALMVAMEFYFPRPKGHFGTGKNRFALKASAPAFHTVKPDVLKLARSTEDALTGIVWRDDAGTPRLKLSKSYAGEDGSVPGCLISIRTLEAQP